jgi:hypothetical protein
MGLRLSHVEQTICVGPLPYYGTENNGIKKMVTVYDIQPIYRKGKKGTQILNVSALARWVWEQDKTLTNRQVTDMLTARFPTSTINFNSVQTALGRARKSASNPKNRSESFKKVEEITTNNPNPEADIESDDIDDIFKQVLKYKKYAAQENVDVKIGEITQILDKSNQLKKNQTDFIKEDKLVEDVCRLILEFHQDIDADPLINDANHMFNDDD